MSPLQRFSPRLLREFAEHQPTSPLEPYAVTPGTGKLAQLGPQRSFAAEAIAATVFPAGDQQNGPCEKRQIEQSFHLNRSQRRDPDRLAWVLTLASSRTRSDVLVTI